MKQFFTSWKILFCIIGGIVLAIVGEKLKIPTFNSLVIFNLGWFGAMIWDIIWKIKESNNNNH